MDKAERPSSIFIQSFKIIAILACGLEVSEKNNLKLPHLFRVRVTASDEYL